MNFAPDDPADPLLPARRLTDLLRQSVDSTGHDVLIMLCHAVTSLDAGRRHLDHVIEAAGDTSPLSALEVIASGAMHTLRKCPREIAEACRLLAALADHVAEAGRCDACGGRGWHLAADHGVTPPERCGACRGTGLPAVEEVTP